MKRIVSVLTILLCIGLFTGCSEPLLDEPLIYLNPDELETRTEDVACSVTKLFTAEDTETKTEMEYGYGYGYDYSSGKTGYFYGMHPTNKTVVVTEYFVVVTDTDDESILFQLEGEDYSLLQEGQDITIRTETRYTPEGKVYGDTLFFWGESKIEMQANVTDKMSHGTLDIKETE